MPTNLPISTISDSAAGTRLFFDSYGQPSLVFPTNDVNATIAFFTSKGFEGDAATVTAAALLKQAKIDGTPIFKILDTLKNFNGLQLSALVAQILNNNRVPTSTLGYKATSVTTDITRNISA